MSTEGRTTGRTSRRSARGTARRTDRPILDSDDFALASEGARDIQLDVPPQVGSPRPTGDLFGNPSLTTVERTILERPSSPQGRLSGSKSVRLVKLSETHGSGPAVTMKDFYTNATFFIYLLFVAIATIIFCYYVNAADWSANGGGAGQYSPNWGTKVSTIIVGVIFAVCVGVTAFCYTSEVSHNYNMKMMGNVVFAVQLILLAALGYSIYQTNFKEAFWVCIVSLIVAVFSLYFAINCSSHIAKWTSIIALIAIAYFSAFMGTVEQNSA